MQDAPINPEQTSFPPDPHLDLHDPEPEVGEHDDHGPGEDITDAEIVARSPRSRAATPPIVSPWAGSAPPADLVRMFQAKLIEVGLLDPVFEGDAATPFRPVMDKVGGTMDPSTCLALEELCALTDYRSDDYTLSGSLLEQLDILAPIQMDDAGGDDQNTLLAKRLLRAMRNKGYWIARSPNMYNIVYVEAMNQDGTLNGDAPNEWNDRRFVIKIEKDGKPNMVMNEQATTEPGEHYTMSPVEGGNAEKYGTARVAFGQYKAWQSGIHGIKHPPGQPALVQRGNLRVHRDGNKNYERDSADFIDVNSNFFVNQHSTAPGQPPILVNRHSAGCLVGRDYAAHERFIEMMKSDVRYKRDVNYLFVSVLMPGKDI